jgi:hypothetical protein
LERILASKPLVAPARLARQLPGTAPLHPAHELSSTIGTFGSNQSNQKTNR